MIDGLRRALSMLLKVVGRPGRRTAGVWPAAARRLHTREHADDRGGRDCAAPSLATSVTRLPACNEGPAGFGFLAEKTRFVLFGVFWSPSPRDTFFAMRCVA